MTQPQPPPSNQPKSGPASSTLDETTKYQALRKLLYDIPLPKAAQATTCIFPLKNLLKARTLIDAINNTVDTQPTTSLDTICTKLEELTAQVDELKKVHTQTTIPPGTQGTIPTNSRQSYAAATTARAPTPASTGTRSQSPDHPHLATSQSPTRRSPPPTHTQQSKRIIMRFIGGSRPAENERMTPHDLRDAVNKELSHARIHIIGAEYTRTGNIALTPHPPCTTDQLLKHSDIFGPSIAHGHSTDEIVFDHDRTWYNAVVEGIQLPRHETGLQLAEVERELFAEITEWNTSFGRQLKWARLLCRNDDLWKKDRGAFLISFEGREEYEEVLRDGVYAFGERCKATPYRARQFNDIKQREDI
jgi:hypothetical protein